MFPEANIEVEGKQNSLFPTGPPNSKIEKNARKSFAWLRLVHKFAAVLRSTTESHVSQKFKLFR